MPGTMSNKGLSIPEAAKLLLDHDHILILTHERPDGDAFGSALGMQEFLRDCCGKHAEAYLPAPPASRYTALVGSYKQTLCPEELKNYDLILLLDCANRARIASGPLVDGKTLPELDAPPMLNVDHHVGNDIDARWNLVIPDAAAASQIAAEIAFEFNCGDKLRPCPATLWLLGILTDTGAFRFTNTIGSTLRVAADLLDRGANLEKVVNASYYSKPLKQQRFEVELLKTQETLALDGQYIYAYIPEELFRKYDFDMRDGEGLIDLLREVEGARVVALFYRKGDAFKVSLRSKDLRCPVGPLARSLGGGGHEMAAGITLVGMDHREVEKLLLEKVAVLLGTDAKQNQD